MRGPWLSPRVLKGEFCRGKLEKLERYKYEMRIVGKFGTLVREIPCLCHGKGASNVRLNIEEICLLVIYFRSLYYIYDFSG